jgi:DUF971 family protein
MRSEAPSFQNVVADAEYDKTTSLLAHQCRHESGRRPVIVHATPVSLKAVDDALQIVWSDGVAHRLTWRMLRDACPCATCREHRAASAVSTDAKPAVSAPAQTGPRPASNLLPVLRIEETRPPRVSRMSPVGNYAYDIDFTDGHNTGIYTLEYLRELGESAPER